MRLTVQIEADKSLDLETPKNLAIIGRSPKSDLIIPHESISRRHCQIEFEKGFYYITDLGSSNGTFIDGEQLAPKTKTPFLTSSQLTIGKCECQLTESSEAAPEGNKVGPQALQPTGDLTATLNMKSAALKQSGKLPTGAGDKKIQPKLAGKKRSTATRSRSKSKAKIDDSKRVYVFLFIIVSVILAFLIFKALA